MIKLDLKPLKKLQGRLQKNIMKKAIRAGAKIIVQDLKKSAPMFSGALRKSIASKVDSKKGSFSAFGVVGPRSKFVLGSRKPSRYAHFLEVGKHPHPFLIPAWLANRHRYLEKVQEVISKEISGNNNI